MNKIILFIGIFLIASNLLVAQEASRKIIKPILVDRATLSGVGLKKIDLKDEPEKDFYQKNIFWGKDLGVFVVSTETWNTKIEDYAFDEFIYMYNGEAVVRPTVGNSEVFYSGDYFFAPKGFKGEWEVKGNNNIHYELSVITTERADSTIELKNTNHVLFSKSILSGNSIVLNDYGLYETVLQKGVELTVKLKGEKPGSYAIAGQSKDVVVHLLAGQVKIVDSAETEYIYYSGDFFILPKNFTGNWTSDGHHLVKYLTVEKTRVD